MRRRFKRPRPRLEGTPIKRGRTTKAKMRDVMREAFARKPEDGQ